MIRLRASFSAALLAVVFASCAKPPAGDVAQPAPAAPEPTAYKNPPRMNGRGKVSSISMEEFFELHAAGKALVFDARPGFFYKLGHIPGAVHLPKDKSDARIHQREPEIKSALAAGKRIVVYCSGPGCPDARTVAMHISGFGYPAAVFSGGWNAWQEAGLPVE